MNDIVNLADRQLTDIEVELPPTHETGIYEGKYQMHGGHISCLTGTKRYLLVFHDGGAAQGSAVSLYDGVYEIRFERRGKALLLVRRFDANGAEDATEPVLLPNVGDEKTLTLAHGRTLVFRRYHPPADTKSDLFRRGNS